MHIPKQSVDASIDPSSQQTSPKTNYRFGSWQVSISRQLRARKDLASQNGFRLWIKTVGLAGILIEPIAGKFWLKTILSAAAISTLLLAPAFAERRANREPASIQYNADQCRAQYGKMDPIDLKQGGCFDDNTPYGNCFHAVDQRSSIAQITDENCLAILANIAFNIHPAPWVWENNMSFDQFKQDLAYQLLQNLMFAQSLNAPEHAEMKKVAMGVRK